MPQNLQLLGYRKFLKKKGLGAFARQIKCVRNNLRTLLIKAFGIGGSVVGHHTVKAKHFERDKDYGVL
jgi:hypothetical protein